ncbi:MAG: thioredoxin domain-containing protein [Pseudomonadota bacterium]
MLHVTPSDAPANRLAGATSPYLQQHARNPVDWYPWGEEAFALARTTGKPVLLSIGYSACHWCHVMAHESFEDPATAAVMNELFVNIKVDREERPDIDRIYQIAHQLLTRRGGGWPLTMFLTHDDQRPFFGGTYFPPEPRYGMPGLRALLERVPSTTAITARNCARSRQPWSMRWPPSMHPPLAVPPDSTTRHSRCCASNWSSASIANMAAGPGHRSSRMPASSSGCCATGIAPRAARRRISTHCSWPRSA